MEDECGSRSFLPCLSFMSHPFCLGAPAEVYHWSYLPGPLHGVTRKQTHDEMIYLRRHLLSNFYMPFYKVLSGTCVPHTLFVTELWEGRDGGRTVVENLVSAGIECVSWSCY